MSCKRLRPTLAADITMAPVVAFDSVPCCFLASEAFCNVKFKKRNPLDFQHPSSHKWSSKLHALIATLKAREMLG